MGIHIYLRVFALLTIPWMLTFVTPLNVLCISWIHICRVEPLNDLNEPCLQIGVYLLHSLIHTSSVALILNPYSANVSPQYLCFDIASYSVFKWDMRLFKSDLATDEAWIQPKLVFKNSKIPWKIKLTILESFLIRRDPFPRELSIQALIKLRERQCWSGRQVKYTQRQREEIISFKKVEPLANKGDSLRMPKKADFS